MNSNSISTKLQELFDLFNSGALSQDEYNQLKSEILNAGSTPSTKPKETTAQPSRQKDIGYQPNFQNEVRKVVFEDKLKVDPLNVALLHEYAQFLFENNYFEASVSAYLKILALNENDAVAQDLLYSLYKKLNWNKDALQVGEQLLLRKPDDISLLEELAKFSSQLGQSNIASDYYERILKLQPQNQNALYNKGLNHISNNQLEAVIEIFTNLYAKGLTDRITTIYTAIGKTISGDYNGAILLLKPILSNGKQAGINDNRGMLYLAYCLCESSVDLDEISQKYSTIDFNILKQNHQLLDEQTAVKITEYVLRRKLSTINSHNNPQLELKQLSDSYLNLEYFTIISNPNIAELWFAIGSKQKELELYDQAKVSYRIAHNLMPEDALYQNIGTEIEELDDARSQKKTRNRIIAIVSVVVFVIAIAASIYAYRYFGEQKAYESAKLENTISAYQSYLDKFPSGRYVSEVKKLQEGEDVVWEDLKRSNSVDGYKNYLSKFPTGKYAVEANDTLTQRRIYAKKQTLDSIIKYAAYGKEYDNVEKYLLGIYPEYAQRTNKTLTLKLDNGKTAVFVNTELNESESNIGEYVISSLSDYIEEINAYLIYNLYYEDWSYHLINKANGNITILSGIPILSNDKKRFAVIQSFYGDNHGFAIYRIDKKNRSAEEYNESAEIMVTHLNWINENEIDAEISKRDSESNFVPSGHIRYIFDKVWKKVE
jgi:tetratricopeptide (TPR) repeat protein